MSDKPLVLIADDDPDLRALVRLHLEMLDVAVMEANNGSAALETILVEQPDLVILDVMMPELTGWEILRYIRSKAELNDLKVLMLTGIGETLNELSSPMYGANDYIDKPFKARELTAKVKKLLGMA